jgi:predicted dienelactone hydrolase
LLLALVTVASQASAVDAPDALGPNAVGHTAFSVFDAARANRELPLEIWYPADATAWAAVSEFTFTELFAGLGITSPVAKDDIALPTGVDYPLVVFSHGYGGFNIQSLGLMEHLASHGFVVVAPNHTGNTQGDTSSPNPEADRFPDVAFVIDAMVAENLNGTSLFFGHVDATNVGVAGHSYGGMTAQFMAAGYASEPADSRVKAIVPIAPSSSALSDEDLAGITIPTTLIVGTLDGLLPQSVRSFDLQSSAPHLSLVEVVGANHTHFANVCDIGNTLIDNGFTQNLWEAIGAGQLIAIYDATCVPPAFPIAEATRLQNLYAAATFRRYLLGETAYASYLTTTFADTEPDVLFFKRGFATDVPVLPPLAQGLFTAALAAAGAARLRRRR